MEFDLVKFSALHSQDTLMVFYVHLDGTMHECLLKLDCYTDLNLESN